MTADYTYGIVTSVAKGAARARSFDGGSDNVTILPGATRRLELRRGDLVRYRIQRAGKRVIAVEPQAYFPKPTPRPRLKKPYYRRLGPCVRVCVQPPWSRVNAAQR